MPGADGRLRVLFLCTGNSCRSRMAEGWARALRGDRIEAFSAGTSPHGLNPLAVRAMREAGVDISRHASKRPEDLGAAFDVIAPIGGAAIAVGFHRAISVPPRGTEIGKADDGRSPR